MRAMHTIRSLTLGMILGCLAVASAGCGDGAEPTGPPEVPADTPGEEAPEVHADDPVAEVANLDVLHLCGKLSIEYATRQYGNEAGQLYWASGLVWNDRSFSVDDSYLMDAETPIEEARTVKVEGTISADHKTIERMAYTLTSKKAQGGREYTEQCTWTNVPLSWEYDPPRKDWKENPRSQYEATLKPDEIAAHVQGWQTQTDYADGEGFSSDQEELLQAFGPGSEGTFTIEVTFSKE